MKIFCRRFTFSFICWIHSYWRDQSSRKSISVCLFSTVLHRIVFSLCCIILCCIVLCCVILYCIVLFCIVLYCIVLYCDVLCYIVLYCIVLYCIVLYCIVLYCIVPSKCSNPSQRYFARMRFCSKRVWFFYFFQLYQRLIFNPPKIWKLN